MVPGLGVGGLDQRTGLEVLERPVRVASIPVQLSKHRLSLRSMSYRMPRRHDENIVRLPDKRSTPNVRTSPAFDNAINRLVRRPRGQAMISSR